MIGHQTRCDWLGEPVLTLADLLPDNPRAVIVGVNPAPASVAVGHYYQGPLGIRIIRRLRDVGLLADDDGFADDAALQRGVGFTDIVKRPTRQATDLSARDYEHGRRLLAERLRNVAAPLVIFSFKTAAERFYDRRIEGAGFRVGLRVGDADVFILPGPYAARPVVDRTLATLRERLGT